MPLAGSFGSLAPLGLGWMPSGAFESIATISLTGNSSTIDFQSIPAGFTHLQLRCILRTDRSSESEDGFTVRFNNDSGSNYAWHRLSGNGSSASAGAGTSATLMSTGVNVISGPSATADIMGAVIIDILDYTSASKHTTIRTFTGHDRNGAGIVALTSGYWDDTAAVNRVTLAPLAGSNFVADCHAALYGVRA